MKKLITVVVASLMITTMQANAAKPLTGEQIVKKSLEGGKGYKDIVQQIKMRLVDPEGKVKERSMSFKALLSESKKKLSLITFTAPKREKGIALLSVSSDKAKDEQFLYLPSTRRVKRVLGASKSASFRGSDFTFEDLGDQSVDEYIFKLVSRENCGDSNCYLVDRFPKSTESNYKRTRLWITEDKYHLVQADFYDKKSNFLKTLYATDFVKKSDSFWYPERLMMVNHKSDSKTEMLVQEITLNQGLAENDFTERALRKKR